MKGSIAWTCCLALIVGGVAYFSVTPALAADEEGASVAGAVEVVEEAAADPMADTPMGDGGGAYPINLLWTVMAAILVFFMQAGFAMVEAGFTRAKNAANIMMKNLVDFSVGSLAFWAIGFALMFGTGGALIGKTGFFLNDVPDEPWTYAFLIFQTVFAATAATIVSGAMAERTKFVGYMAYSVFITALIYPIFGHWAWGSLFGDQGWLEGKGFMDFAGSTVVHSIGGWCALAGAIVVGPRRGKYNGQGKVKAIPGHSLTLATLGVFILWMGWFGFNPGSTTSVTGEAGKAFAKIAVNTNLSACAGALAALFTTWCLAGKPELGMSLNGALAGLVGITAPCNNIEPWAAVAVGLISGVLVVLSVRFFDSIKIDDPVGAISVHGVCGAWGTLAVAIFDSSGSASFMAQVIGIGAGFLWAFGTAFILFKIVAATVGLRVSEQEEIEGLDIGEHGNEAYPEFAARFV